MKTTVPCDLIAFGGWDGFLKLFSLRVNQYRNNTLLRMKVDRYMFYKKYDIQWLDDEYGIYLYE